MCTLFGLEIPLIGGLLSTLFSSGAAAGATNGTTAAATAMSSLTAGFMPGITSASIASSIGAGTAATATTAGSSMASTLALAGGIAGATAGVAGGAMTAVDAMTTGNEQAKIAENNAKIAQDQKQQEAGVNHRDQSDLMRRASIEKGKGIGSFGASGIDMSSGTVGSWLNDFDTGMNRDLSTMDYNSKLKQWGLENERRNSLSQAKIYRRQIPLNAAAGLTSGVLGGVSALGSGIGTFSKLGGKF